MPYFLDHEFIDPETVSPLLRQKLETTRQLAGIPMIITGSKRPRDGERKTAHESDDEGTYHGVDVRANDSRTRFLILRAAFEVGFSRIGVYNKHIHLDVATGLVFHQDVTWWGESK